MQLRYILKRVLAIKVYCGFIFCSINIQRLYDSHNQSLSGLGSKAIARVIGAIDNLGLIFLYKNRLQILFWIKWKFLE